MNETGSGSLNETFEKCSILFKAKEGENFNHRNTWSISRIALKLHCVQNLSLTPGLSKRGRFSKVSKLHNQSSSE
jgi:hypothetical protein